MVDRCSWFVVRCSLMVVRGRSVSGDVRSVPCASPDGSLADWGTGITDLNSASRPISIPRSAVHHPSTRVLTRTVLTCRAPEATGHELRPTNHDPRTTNHEQRTTNHYQPSNKHRISLILRVVTDTYFRSRGVSQGILELFR